MNDDNIKKSSTEDILKGLSESGRVRAAILLGPNDGNLAGTISKWGGAILQNNPNSFWICLDALKTNTPYEWCSQFARNLRTNQAAPVGELVKFALSTGKSLSAFKKSAPGDVTDSQTDENVATALISNFEALVNGTSAKPASPHLVLAINNLGVYTDQMLDWLGTTLNPLIRKSKAFKGARFLFTSDTISGRDKAFFDLFGFEKMHMAEVGSVDPQMAKEKNEPTDLKLVPVPETSVTLKFEPDEHSQKPLKKNTLPVSVKIVNNLRPMDIRDAEKILSSFKEDELSYLFLASYPTRVSRYTLEHFASDRDAALSYNWLNRSKSLHTVSTFGDLLLNDDLRIAARTVHSQKFKEVSEQWSTLAQVLDTFQVHFPNNSKHWIPINLQLMESFNRRMLKQLFDGDELSDVLEFVDQYKDVFIEKESRLSLSDESKLIIRRYLELSERTCLPRLSERIHDIWLKDQEHYKIQKAKMLEEKENISSEIGATLKQVVSLKELKDNLVGNAGNPNRNKPERIYTFSASRALIVIGLGTVGASLLSDSIGSYHAACGLALTLFGFFWPNVEVKRPALAAVGSSSNLAIETQERSLNHRVGSLTNRIQVMKGNLDTVEKQLSKLGDTPPLPYLDSDTDAETS